MWPLDAAMVYKIIQPQTAFAVSLTGVMLSGVSTDSRTVAEGDLFIAIPGENFDGHNYVNQALEHGACCALVNHDWWQRQKESFESSSPPWFLQCWPVAETLTSFRQFAKVFRQSFPFSVIAVGGSNGKTTTKELLTSCLGARGKITKTFKSENGFLGVALTLCQKAHHKEHPPYALVLEIGIDEVGAMEQHVELSQPDVSLLTALGPEHLQGLRDLPTVISEELKIFDETIPRRIWQLGDDSIRTAFEQRYLKNSHAFKNDAVVCPLPLLTEFLKALQVSSPQDLLVGMVCAWELQTGATTTEDVLSFSVWSQSTAGSIHETGILCPSPLPGRHNAQNLALAFVTARWLGTTPAEILQGLKRFVAPPLRSVMRPLGTSTLFEDCYNSSPLSAQAALKWIQENPVWQNRRKVLILGDMRELGDQSVFWHETLADQIESFSNTVVFLYGDAMEACYQRFLKIHQWTSFGDMSPLNFQRQVSWIPTAADPTVFVKHTEVLKNAVILVKGSRGMRLERVIKALEGVII